MSLELSLRLRQACFPMTSAYPLICHEPRDPVLAVSASGPVSVEDFLRDAMDLAERLPVSRYLVNLCVDRYRFAVTLAAALLRDQVTLLPPSESIGVVADLATQYDGAYVLHDGAAPRAAIPTMLYPAARQHAGVPMATPLIPGDRTAIVLFTSGSTGRPAPHMKTWGSLVRSAKAAGRALGVAALPGATILGTVPQQHSYGFESTVMLALQHGLALHHARPFYPADIAACIEAARQPRILVTTPIHLRAMLADASRLPSVDLVVSATAPLSPELAREAESAFSARLIEIYGCSEAGQLATRQTVEGDEWQCLQGVSLRADFGGSWVSGEAIEGEVLLNDVVELRAPDRFCLLGRTADLVNIAGKRTSLVHLNHVLNAIAGVRDGVFIMPEDGNERTTRLMALVVAPGLSVDAIMTALRERIDPAFLPRPLRIVDALPRNPLGKLPREAVLRAARLRRDPSS
jgi:acyl-coenzyme A synthetase/AMP-(fatty) acid ligase